MFKKTFDENQIKCQKRNGEIVDFVEQKIENAVKKAFEFEKVKINSNLIKNIILKTKENFKDKIVNGVIGVEDIQDAVELSLVQLNFLKVAHTYISYRNKHAIIRNNNVLDTNYIIEKYLKNDSWRVKENSTVSYSVGGLILSNSSSITANYWLTQVYDEEIRNAYKNSDIHIHDLGMLTGYCAGWSLKDLVKIGLSGVEGKIASAPAKHLSTLCNQMVNFLGIMQNEWAGAQAFSSFDTYLAPFVRTEKLSYKQVKQCIQSFIYGINIPSRWGTQPPFTNITLDWNVPDDMANLNVIVGGEELPFKYKDCVKEMAMINKAFMEIMIEGDMNGRGFQYPIPTYSITKDFDWSESENNKLLFEMTAKYGIPYFSNYVNSDMKPSDVRSMCCRLRLDLRELRKKSGGFFGSGESTGSIGVVTINMPKIAYLSKNKTDFFNRLKKIMDLSARSLKIKRDFLSFYLEKGLFPYTKRYLGTFNNHFSTIGVVGMNEMCLNAKWIKSDLISKESQDFVVEVLNFIREKLSDYQEKYHDLYNLEATPAESTCYRLAKNDKEKYPDIITSCDTNKVPYYTNSSHLPVDYTDDIFKALDIEDKFQVLYTSGTVFHSFLGQKISSWKTCMNLVKKIATNYRLPYYTISPTYSICKTHGYINGEEKVCPKCGNQNEIYSRITGYYRPIKNWNIGKISEFNCRKEYNINEKKIKKINAKKIEKNSEFNCHKEHNISAKRI